MYIYGISFKAKGKIYDFVFNAENLDTNEKVIVQTEKGEQIGFVVSKKSLAPENNKYKEIIRKATDEDYERYLQNLNDAKKALLIAKKESEKLNLKMSIIDAEYTFDKSQLLFNFVSDERIDFRELVKILAATFKTRIELHQMGARDKARNINGLSQCGRTLCCAGFLGNIEGISINMAKNQNLALTPSKINGQCGRLLCCLAYEDSTYKECSKGMPNQGQTIEIDGVTGRVISVDILNRSYKVQFKNEIREINLT